MNFLILESLLLLSLCLSPTCFARVLTKDESIIKLPSESNLALPPVPALLTPEERLISDLLNDSIAIIVVSDDITLTEELPVVSRNLTIAGNCSSIKKPAGGLSCEINGNNTFRIFQVESPKDKPLNFTLLNLSLKNATAKFGSAVLFTSYGLGTLELNSVVIAENNATGNFKGGSAVHTDSSVILNSTIVVGNNGTQPALFVTNKGKDALLLNVTSSRFFSNVGGAIGSSGLVQPAVFAGSMWSGNKNATGGAAIDLKGGNGEDSVLDLFGCMFTANHGGDAGAVSLDGYSFIIRTGTFAANVGEGLASRGGAISAANHGGASFLTSVIMTANSATTAGGIYGDGGSVGICSSVVVANKGTISGLLENVVLEGGDEIAIWPMFSVFGATGAPIVYNITEACGAPVGLELLTVA